MLKHNLCFQKIILLVHIEWKDHYNENQWILCLHSTAYGFNFISRGNNRQNNQSTVKTRLIQWGRHRDTESGLLPQFKDRDKNEPRGNAAHSLYVLQIHLGKWCQEDGEVGNPKLHSPYRKKQQELQSYLLAKIALGGLKSPIKNPQEHNIVKNRITAKKESLGR